MHTPSAAELLDVWERCRDRPPLDQGLALLSIAYPEQPPEALAGLSIGARDGRLMLLRRWAFGDQVASLAVCPACGAQVELGFDLKELAGDGVDDPDAGRCLELTGYTLRFRLPDSRDLLALRRSSDGAQVRQQLLARCILSVEHEGQALSAADLPGPVLVALAEAMAVADPLADIRLGLSCPACAHSWQVGFDIVSFFWRELDAWARRTLREVHTLARAYGWREPDILALSARRRQSYLEILADE